MVLVAHAPRACVSLLLRLPCAVAAARLAAPCRPSRLALACLAACTRQQRHPTPAAAPAHAAPTHPFTEGQCGAGKGTTVRSVGFFCGVRCISRAGQSVGASAGALGPVSRRPASPRRPCQTTFSAHPTAPAAHSCTCAASLLYRVLRVAHAPRVLVSMLLLRLPCAVAAARLAASSCSGRRWPPGTRQQRLRPAPNPCGRTSSRGTNTPAH
jgi:hypothetical protein